MLRKSSLFRPSSSVHSINPISSASLFPRLVLFCASLYTSIFDPAARIYCIRFIEFNVKIPFFKNLSSPSICSFHLLLSLLQSSASAAPLVRPPPSMRKTHFFPFSVAKLIHPSAQSSSVTVHVVTVGAANGSLTYSPSKINAEVGSMIQFQFMPKNHTITQSNFDKPCEPLAMHSNVAGIFSGFMPVAADATSIPTYTIVVNHTETMWMYCSQGMHCQAGMAMVINEK
jgi:plastocyanin